MNDIFIDRICPNCNTRNIIQDSENNIKLFYLCIKCGYHTNSDYKTSSKQMLEYSNSIPSDILNLSIYENDTDLHWFPMILVLKNSMVIPRIVGENIFKWTYIKLTTDDSIGECILFDKYDFLIACNKLGNLYKGIKIND